MFSLNQKPGRTTFVDEKEYLFYSGYAYLGMNHDPSFIQLIHEGLDKFGPIFPSSRISNTSIDIYRETENRLSIITGLPLTILFPSGFTAGKAVVESLPLGSTFFHAPFCHPAIRLGSNSVLPFTEWANETVQTINNNVYENPPIILSDSLNQLTAELYDFSFLNKIKQNVICVIDDSHGIGLTGNNGAGVSAQIPRNENVEFIISYSLSKALNIQAGAVSCTNEETASKIRKTTWYTAVTPPSPAMLFAFCKATHIYDQQRGKLKIRINEFRNLIKDKSGIIFNDHLPVFILPETLDEDYFAKKDIIISSFAYPDPSGKKINRAVLNALHTHEDLKALANTI